MTDHAKLIEDVRMGRKCRLPSPRSAGATVRVMGYVEGYLIVRHPGAMPFVWYQKDAIRFLEARAAEGARP